MGFHMPELIILLVVALLIFGPKKLPEMGSVIGKSIRAFRKGMDEIAKPKDEETPDPAQQHSLPESNKELRGLADVPVTSEEIDADKRAN